MQVRPVASRSEQKAFLRLPFDLYADDPNWVPPLLVAERDRLDRRKNPFYEHAEAEYFVAWDGNRAVGRIAAIDDALHNEVHGDNLAFFGFFEANAPETAAALFAAAEGWARERGRDVLRGPANPSLNDTAGLLVEGFDRPPVVMMPYNPAHYADFVEAAGFAKAKDLWAWWWPVSASVTRRSEKVLARIERSLDPVPDIRTVTKRTFERDMEAVREIFIEAWKQNWGFVPPTEAEFRHAAKDMKPILDWELLKVLEIDGRPIAFALTLWDLNQVFRHMNGRLLPFGIFKLLRRYRYMNQGRQLLLGVLPEYRQKGLEIMLIADSIRYVETRGWVGGECSWTLEDNHGISKAIRLIGGEHYKTYRMYDKPLS